MGTTAGKRPSQAPTPLLSPVTAFLSLNFSLCVTIALKGQLSDQLYWLSYPGLFHITLHTHQVGDILGFPFHNVTSESLGGTASDSLRAQSSLLSDWNAEPPASTYLFS